ncbi:hypothetical protein Q7P37_000138 [Cladosporium fusiforme]
MHPQHVAARLFRKSSWTRFFSLVAVPLLVIAWIYAIHAGERGTYREHVESCNWSSWEDWPAGATPHHLVFIADPQIVDPHTYPGRPWPLSYLTERYTDRYMRRNYQLINEKLDPDSVVFLGDLFDGGREWAPETSRPLKSSQRKKVAKIKSNYEKQKKEKEKEQKEKEAQEASTSKPTEGSEEGKDDNGAEHAHLKRSWESYATAVEASDHPADIRVADHNIDKRGNDLKVFKYGEKGRWKSWGMNQWNEEYDRFGKMFFEPGQLYPKTQRRTIAAWDVSTHPLNVMNGANDVNHEEHAVIGGKARHLLTSLPGNHDVGFGPGVQLAVRDRFQARFGESNRVDVLGNHSFISIDAPSLAAFSQFEINGDTPREKADERQHIWKPAMDFLDGVQTSAAKAAAEAMDEYYPDSEKKKVKLPVILLTHEPLYRDPGTDCGKLRERGHAISISGGYQYQNTLTRTLSNLVAQKVGEAGDIAHVFSGDDHDHCDVWHRYNVGSMGENRSPRLTNVRETTVKSFSWAMGVRRPGFQLLSLWNPVDANGHSISGSSPTAQTHMCLLPDQIGILVGYGKLAGFTILVLLTRAILISIRGADPAATGEESDKLSELSLPRFRNQGTPNSSANGYSTPDKSEFKGRQRASSTGLKSINDSQTLGVQRSYNARTRSVSPAPGFNPAMPPGGLPNVPMFEKPALYANASDDSDDEESRYGSFDGVEPDSQAKWRRKRHGLSRPRVAFGEFTKSLCIVAAFGVTVYLYRIWSW